MTNDPFAAWLDDHADDIDSDICQDCGSLKFSDICEDCGAM
jgi:hypothetical protein